MYRPLYLFITLVLLSSIAANAQTDTLIGISLQSYHGTDIDAVAADLCIDYRTEKQKANAIYNWITHNIAYDVEGMWTMGDYDEDKPRQALKTKKAVSAGYAELFTALCRSAGLSAVSIDGYAKDFIFDNGDKMYIPRHEWNAVKIDGKWELVDVTWGAGYMHQSNSKLRILLSKLLMQKKLKAKNIKFKFHYEPQYFMQDPEAFRLKHLPADPLWQLTDTAMSLHIFEMGDSAVLAFNNNYSHLQQSSPVLDRIAALGAKERDIEAAERAYKFNNRFSAILAIKNSILVDSMLTKLEAEGTDNEDTTRKVLREATESMKQAVAHIKTQKKGLPEEYSRLNRKNKAKAQEARQYIRQIKADDKRLLATCKKYTKSADSKYGRSRSKLSDVQRRARVIATGNINKVQPTKVQKNPGSPELEVINDSVEAREARIDAMLTGIRSREAVAKNEVLESKVLLDSLANSITLEDSMLRKEATARLNMKDNYDDEVIRWSSMFKIQKYQTTDTLMKYYFAGFDSTAAKYELLQKQYIATLNVFKSNVRSLEQYKKMAGASKELTDRYAATVQGYSSIIDSAARCISDYGKFLNNNKEVFAGLNKLGVRQLKIVEFMEKAEKSRETLEQQTIARKKYNDLKENEQMKNNAETAVKKLKKATSTLGKE